jgi:hypothetical protein
MTITDDHTGKIAGFERMIISGPESVIIHGAWSGQGLSLSLFIAAEARLCSRKPARARGRRLAERSSLPGRSKSCDTSKSLSL